MSVDGVKKVRIVVPSAGKVKRTAHTFAEEVTDLTDVTDQESRAGVSYIPDPSVTANYVNRHINDVWDFTMLDYCQKHAKNVLLLGPTGSGKTMVGSAYAATNGQRYYSLPCVVSIEPSELFGRMIPTDTVGKYVWQDGPVTEIVRHGGVLNISEINFMPARIAASLYPLLDGRRYIPLLGHGGEIVKAHRNLLIIADMNPNYHGTQPLNEALRNRFNVKVHWDYDATVESSLVKSAALLDLVRRIREMTKEVVTPISTNAMIEYVTLAVEFGVKFASENFAQIFNSREQPSVRQLLDASENEIARQIKFLKDGNILDSAIEDMEEEDATDPAWREEDDNGETDDLVTEYIPR